ncbi:hypothetical protein GCM10007415_16820 [Parapedobacter pyrenivorans]|uniref:DUF3347 domain-containing protein n=2 Tax=Parapedobacter pyrenivorans TaxID=1305674 RepID=A0A917HNR4_9SPHI|nr:hypothetical protein GCM10007415_16820 [Parapedobacter pyrenivorans]
MVIAVSLSSINSFAQIKDAETATVTIYGNCEMCKATIEEAGNVKREANVQWDQKTKVATLTYNSGKTDPDEILKRIALAGYDSENFLAPDDVYAKLPECCQYNRALKPTGQAEAAHAHHQAASPANTAVENASQLQPVFDYYFSIKDALVKTDAPTASAKAAELVAAIGAVEMDKLTTAEHTAWMNVLKGLTANAERVSTSKDIAKQREAFAALSTQLYELAKVSKQDIAVYHQHCPMYSNGKGANWLSKENAVKNPYYGAQMLTCGETVEIIK